MKYIKILIYSVFLVSIMMSNMSLAGDVKTEDSNDKTNCWTCANTHEMCSAWCRKNDNTNSCFKGCDADFNACLKNCTYAKKKSSSRSTEDSTGKTNCWTCADNHEKRSAWCEKNDNTSSCFKSVDKAFESCMKTCTFSKK